ncbi:hypothetical protein CPLU01_04356 [Colletotrichum plurivorum]|uniref:Uncharacterized protein n=1 Tax=Colletotrichum plurivorum TaxID=2175906 RepID=A0A8H6NJZ2_9PEZI|nr:hypothetical protein CPLU01_04356 [Colletotrichum plurivorum]
MVLPSLMSVRDPVLPNTCLFRLCRQLFEVASNFNNGDRKGNAFSDVDELGSPYQVLEVVNAILGCFGKTLTVLDIHPQQPPSHIEYKLPTMEPRASSPPPNGVTNPPEPRSSSPPPNGVANAPETRSSSPPPQPDGEPDAIQPRPATPPPQDGFIGLGPRSFPLFPRVEPHANGPLSSSPPFPSDEPDATEPKAAEPDAAEPRATDHEPRHNDVDRPVPAKWDFGLGYLGGTEPKWKFKISEDSLKPDASHETFFAAWRQSITPRGLLRKKIDREEVRLLKMARVRAALHSVTQDHDALCREWCSKKVENFNSVTAQDLIRYSPPLPSSTDDRPLRYLFTARPSCNPIFRPVAIYEADGRVHAIYIEFRQCDYRDVEKPSWTRKSWRTCVEFDSDGLFKKTESFLMRNEKVFKGPQAEMMKFANRVEEVGTDYVF